MGRMSLNHFQTMARYMTTSFKGFKRPRRVTAANVQGTSEGTYGSIPEVRLGIAILERACRDAIDPYGTGIAYGVERDARVWLLSEANDVGSAIWWSEMCGMQNYLEKARKKIREIRP